MGYSVVTIGMRVSSVGIATVNSIALPISQKRQIPIDPSIAPVNPIEKPGYPHPMTAPLKPTIRLLGGCARVASILAMSSASVCFAQQSVATLGIPSAASAAGPSVLPILADELAKTDDALVGAPGMFLSAFAESKPAEPALNAATDANQTQILVDSSPSKWVHQPLFADHVQRPEGANTIATENSIDNKLRPVIDILTATKMESALSDSTPAATHVRPLTEIRRAAMR